MENPGKESFLGAKTDKELEDDMKLYLTMDNLGGKLADDTLWEIFQRQAEKEKK